MATGVNIFINKILDDLFPPLSTPNHISSPIVHHSVDATVLNPDALNLNYDSDDSMQVDSENEQVNNHHTLVDNFQDLDAEDVGDTTSLAIAGKMHRHRFLKRNARRRSLRPTRLSNASFRSVMVRRLTIFLRMITDATFFTTSFHPPTEMAVHLVDRVRRTV
jgi:hypothetical protein